MSWLITVWQCLRFSHRGFAGTFISAPTLITGAGVIAVLLLVKLTAKMIGVWPVAAAFKLPRRERTYTTLLMATGLTFGSIAALFGLTHHFIDKTQYTELVTVSSSLHSCLR